jgi:FkbM family methyltransferase
MKLHTTKLHWWLNRKSRKKNIISGEISQYGQDRVAFELLKKQKSGTFIDIGANDGLSLSNSLLFEKNGWTGVCVEPNPVIFEDLSNSRNCECLNACISDSDGIVSFLAIDGPANMLSGIQDFLDESSLERIDREIKEKGGSKSIMEVESITPKSLLERFNLQSVDFDVS